MCRKLIHLISLVFVLSAAGNASADLVARWAFDEGSGTIAFDSSGNGHDGTLIGDPKWVAGKIGGALEFNGTDSMVDIPYSPDMTPSEGTTMAAWVFPTDTTRSCIVGQFEGYGMALFTDLQLKSVIWGGDWVLSDVTIPVSEWSHIVMTWDVANSERMIFLNGELVGTRPDSAVPSVQNNMGIGLWVGWPAGWGDDSFMGIIDDVRIYDHILSEVEIQAAMEGGKGFPFAMAPNPADGAMIESTWANISWRAGDFAVSHNVYMGDSLEDVDAGAESTFIGDQVATNLVVGFVGFPFPDGLVPGKTYYWRIDEVNDADPNSPWKGNIWSFWIPPRKAYDPSPADGVGVVQTDTTLNWATGFNGKIAQMYFGTDAAEVEAGAGGTAKGPVASTTYDPGPLEEGTTYYWRVDQFDGTETHTGDVWSLTTVPVIGVSDPDLKAWWTMEEGAGAVVVDQSGNGNHGSFVGDIQWADGYQGTALEFAGGSAGSPTYVNFGNSSSLQLTGSITISAWVKMNPGNAGAYMGIGGKLVSGTYKGYALVRHSSNVFRLWCDDGAGVLAGHEASSNVPYTDTEWHHVVGVVDGLISSLYVDGVKQAQQGSVNLTESGVYAYIGKQYGDNSSHRYWNGLIDDVRIYSKALTDDEVAEVMRGNKKLAASPSPSGYSIVDIRDISLLNWSKGDTAASHDVYFGTDRDAMELQGNQTATSLPLADLVEFGGGDYFWRIDEVESDGTVIVGTVWKFTVPDYLIVDDFESYNDIDEGEAGSNRVYLTWIDGFGTTTNGAVAGNLDPPFMSAGHNSSQAMPLSYDNAGKTSEATRTLTSKKDWTVEDVTKLVIWFSGAAGNAADRMFVASGNAVVYHPDDAATQDGGWNEWVIELQELANQGVDLTNVGSITLGIGTRGAPVATGGTGTVHFDDIRLTR